MGIKTVFCNTVLCMCVCVCAHVQVCTISFLCMNVCVSVFSVFFMFVSVLSVRDSSQEINV